MNAPCQIILSVCKPDVYLDEMSCERALSRLSNNLVRS